MFYMPLGTKSRAGNPSLHNQGHTYMLELCTRGRSLRLRSLLLRVPVHNATFFRIFSGATPLDDADTLPPPIILSHHLCNKWNRLPKTKSFPA